MAAQGATTGRWVWHDLMTTDPEAAKRFYSELCGWKFKAVDMGPAGTYQMIQVGDRGVGGIVPLDKTHGVPSHWVGYVSVPDVDAAAAKAGALGGKTCVPPTDIPDVGRFAVVEDPSGAVFSPFKDAQAGDGGHGIEPGMFCWNELLTTDTAKATSFYTGLLGWTSEAMDMGPGGTYTLFKASGNQECGMMAIGPHMAGARPAWIPYVVAADVDASTARAAKLGGNVIAPPMDIPNVGRFSMVVDPTGGVFSLFKGTEALAAQAKK